MSAGRLIEFFACFTKLPIYAEDVRDQIIELGIQDEIIFRPIDVDPQVLKGMYLRYRTSAPYAEHRNVSVIFYNAKVSPDMQNFICIKELMHVFDETIHAAVTTTAHGLNAHLSYLFKNGRDEPVASSLSGIIDRAAEWLAIAVMFPDDVRDDFMAALREKHLDETQFAAELGIPINFVSELISDRWETFREMLLAL